MDGFSDIDHERIKDIFGAERVGERRLVTLFEDYQDSHKWCVATVIDDDQEIHVLERYTGRPEDFIHDDPITPFVTRPIRERMYEHYGRTGSQLYKDGVSGLYEATNEQSRILEEKNAAAKAARAEKAAAMTDEAVTAIAGQMAELAGGGESAEYYEAWIRGEDFEPTFSPSP